ncbi:unnamed protein product [Miscanthus lutarioriparius]|uniref:CASP-like protein n=1 Tax=Miscanthus lutarioriparius TaxID=422564 RepID=A0A811NPS2_9POAL|nr:unnamed protein product [Miscanthus lutarioriparius]
MANSTRWMRRGSGEGGRAGGESALVPTLAAATLVLVRPVGPTYRGRMVGGAARAISHGHRGLDVATTTESGKQAPSPPPAARRSSFSGADLALRALLFAVTLAGLVVLATAKQTALVPVPQNPGLLLSRPAKFNDSPALM